MPITVVVCYTGGVGSQVVRLLARRPDIRLVGVLVSDPRKHGKDAGALVGLPSLGVRATTDLDEILALRADCALWHGAVWNIEAVARFLRQGTNVYSGAGGWYLVGEPESVLLEEACRAGNATLAAGGNIPGVISDALPLFLSGYSGRITKIRAWQRNYNADYPSALQLREGCGFGVPPERQPIGAPIDEMWLWGIRQSARMVADGLGVPLDAVKVTNKEFGLTPEDMVLEASGLHIPAGMPAGVRWTFTAFSRGAPFFVLINEQTARVGLGPDWRHSVDQPNWRVEIEGSPNIACEFSVAKGADRMDGVAALNAARAVNFIPTLVAAPPGCRSVLDLPAPSGRFESPGSAGRLSL